MVGRQRRHHTIVACFFPYAPHTTSLVTKNAVAVEHWLPVLFETRLTRLELLYRGGTEFYFRPRNAHHHGD